MQSDNVESVPGKPGGDDRGGEQPTKPRAFRIQIDKKPYEVHHPKPTGLELLTLAGKVPPEQFALYLRNKGSQPLRIGLNDKVDLEEPGVERFVTLPLDQTEG